MKMGKMTLLTGFILLMNSLYLNAASAPSEERKNSESHYNKDKIELETLKIQGNKELPKVLFIVPWQDPSKKKGNKSEQRLVLHSLYGDLFDPLKPMDFKIDINAHNKIQE